MAMPLWHMSRINKKRAQFENAHSDSESPNEQHLN